MERIRKKLHAIAATGLAATAIAAVTAALAGESFALTTADCLTCHTPQKPATVTTMHHALKQFDCVYCHKLIWDTSGGYTVEVIRNDCTRCHGETGHEAAHDHGKPDAAACLQCHNSNLVVEHANRGVACSACHSSLDAKVISAIDKGKGTAGQDVFCSDCHGSINHHNSVACTVCHAQTGDMPVKDKCFQCHIAIRDKYNSSTATFGGFDSRKGYYTKVNTKHDVECAKCHNTHIMGSLVNPDSKRDAFTATIKHPGTGATVLDSKTFCLKCHDNTWATDGSVKPPAAMLNIAKTFSDAGAQGEQHGSGAGSGRGVLRGPYAAAEASSNISGVPSMPCMDCHDPHASQGLYMLKTLTDQFGKPFTITPTTVRGNTAKWCSSCHTNPMNKIDASKEGCLSGSCHTHSLSSF